MKSLPNEELGTAVGHNLKGKRYQNLFPRGTIFPALFHTQNKIVIDGRKKRRNKTITAICHGHDKFLIKKNG